MLREVLSWIVGGGGAGIIAYFALGKILPRDYRGDYKRYAAFAMAGVIGTLAFVLGVWMGWESAPTTAQGWVMTLFEYAALAIGTSQIIHARELKRN